MTFDISKYPEPEDYGEVLLRLIASPHRRPARVIEGAANLPGAQPGDALILIGETKGHLGASLYAREWLGLKQGELGRPPPVDFDAEKKNADFSRSLIEQGLVNAVHYVSEGGIACAAVEMALASNLKLYMELDSGHAMNWPAGKPYSAPGFLFGEPFGCYLIAGQRAEQIYEMGLTAGIRISWLGLGDFWAKNDLESHIDWADSDLLIEEDFVGIRVELPLSRLREAHEGWLPPHSL